MTLVAILTPVRAEHAQALRDHLRGLDAPFAGLQTHFARFVVLDAGGPALLFSAKFDGHVGDYLAAIARLDAALEIWRHCRRPDPCTKDELLHYLLAGEDRVPAQYVIDMLPSTATVAGINAALALRAKLSAFCARAAGLDAVALAHELRQLMSGR
ncbi:MAG: hypothetical protein ABSG43_09785 [Solirubrobacteraceae bacterium]|jgi:hypothetical protein